mgnify:CR=1 FL=1
MWEDTDTNLMEFVSTMLRNFWGFVILSDADSNVFLRDEINIPIGIIVDNKLTFVKSFHRVMIASGVIIH